MQWSIPALLFAAAFAFWRLSFRADDALVAWLRFIFAAFLLCIAATYALALTIHTFGWLA